MSLTHRSTIDQPTHDGAAGWWRAQLVVDNADPVIFDHDIDHVPVMQMLHGIAEVIERAAAAEPPGSCAAGSFDLHFTRFVEKDCPTYITVVPAAAPSGWRVELTQSDQVVCTGTASTITPADPGDSPVSAPPRPPALADATLVHRHRPENIVVTALRKHTDGYAVDYVPSEAVRTKRFQSFHHPLDVVEASRQFVTLLCHAVCGFDLRTHLIPTRVVVTTPRVVPRTGTVRLFSAEPRVTRRLAVFTTHAEYEDAPATTVTWDVHAIAPRVYARLRGGSYE
jgi:hypothetical protein